MSEAPFMSCPSCDKNLIQAEDRGRFDKDGNFVQHKITCRCRHCNWIWWEDQRTVCSCGAEVYVTVDDGHAYARIVK